MRFPTDENADCPKAPCDFMPRKDGILHRPLPPPSGCLGTALPLPQSLYGRTGGRADGRTGGRAGGRTLTSQPKFLGSKVTKFA